MSGDKSKLPENNLPENDNGAELNEEDLEQVAGGAIYQYINSGRTSVTDGIDGESQDDKHKGEIQIESFSWGKK